MAKGKYAVRAANKRAFASHASAEDLRKDLDLANREIERLNRQLLVTQEQMDTTIERLVREALRDERQRMKSAMRENAMLAQQQKDDLDRRRRERDAVIVEKLEIALRALLARAVELTGGEKIIDLDDALVINEVFEDLGAKNSGSYIRSVLGIESHGQIAHVDGYKIQVSARYLNRRSRKRVERDAAENRQDRRLAD